MIQDINFRKMSESEYANWAEWSVSDYAKSLIISGHYSETEAKKQAEEELYSYLTNGLSTPDHYLYMIENDDGVSVGLIWYETVDPECAFIADFLVYDEYRRKGYGHAILMELEHILSKRGIPNIELHVFEYNTAAIKLYEKCGYTSKDGDDADTGSVYMSKRILNISSNN